MNSSGHRMDLHRAKKQRIFRAFQVIVSGQKKVLVQLMCRKITAIRNYLLNNLFEERQLSVGIYNLIDLLAR